MTISKHEITAEVEVEGVAYPLDIISGNLGMDDSWSPYIQGELTCWAPDEATLDLIDPRDNLRVTVAVAKEFGTWNTGQHEDQTRTFDLLLREREVDHTEGTMTIKVESDEGLLQDFGLVSLSAERVAGLSVKGAVGYALGKIGAALAPGASDANIESKPALPSYTNLIPNPSAETNTTGWVPAGGLTTLSRSTAQAWIGSASIQVRADSVSVSPGPSMSSGVPATPGSLYTFSCYVKANVARTVNVNVRFSGASGVISTHTEGRVMVAGADWVRMSVTATAPAGTTSVSAFTHIVAASTGDTGWWDGFMLTATPAAVDYFDGNTADTIEYDHAWTGTANASASTKTWIPNSDATVWSPGVTGWDFLEPLIQSVGFRLYCNEDRDWILEPSGTTRDGQINVAEGFNLTEGTDIISRYREWFDSVVIKYTGNLDVNGQNYTTYDVAGAPGTKAITIEYDRATPGLGAAQAILDRALGRGRVLGLTGISDYEVTPGMSVVATLPKSPIQSGLISSVRWTFPENTMTIGSRGLADTPPGAWLLAEEGRAWADIPVGTDWSEYTP